MAKANRWHQAGNTYRRTTHNKIPIQQRRHNREKWKEKNSKERKQLQRERRLVKAGNWWKKKFGKGDDNGNSTK